MKDQLKCHVFICTNCKSQEEQAQHVDKENTHDAKNLRDLTKKKSKTLFGKSVRINKSGCLGRCDEGVACVLYPSAKWLTELSSGDTDKVIEAIEKELDPKS